MGDDINGQPKKEAEDRVLSILHYCAAVICYIKDMSQKEAQRSAQKMSLQPEDLGTCDGVLKHVYTLAQKNKLKKELVGLMMRIDAVLSLKSAKCRMLLMEGKLQKEKEKAASAAAAAGEANGHTPEGAEAPKVPSLVEQLERFQKHTAAANRDMIKSEKQWAEAEKFARDLSAFFPTSSAGVLVHPAMPLERMADYAMACVEEFAVANDVMFAFKRPGQQQ
ncbi:hypothetical protein HK101_003552 [Irineochytrium annulatum]|nr:hypothetical protein HK101_003552 [Irineochytrium annulatum]